MLEIFAIIALCRTNSRNADMRGRSTAWAKAYTVLLWIGFEFGGGFLAGMLLYAADLDFGYGFYFIALIGAGLGALISYLIAKRGAPIAMPYGNLNMNETAYIQNAYQLNAPCEVVVIREKSFVGMAAKFEIQLNGQMVGSVGNGQTISIPTYTSQNIITGSDALGMRFNTSVPFEAPACGRVEFF